jgi:hypothetical protein
MAGDTHPHVLDSSQRKTDQMPRSKKAGWIEWKGCKARWIILEDLEKGILSLEENEVSTMEAWGVYSALPEFEGVAFSQFKERLFDHRKQVKKRKNQSDREMQAFLHDRQLHPRQTHNHRGELVFELSVAKKLLEEDVRDKRHTTMVPSELQRTRQEYMSFKPNKFKHRIYQEVRRQKFIFYLELKRAKGAR